MKSIVDVKNGELYYCGLNLKSVATKYGTPLKITFLDLIKERAITLKSCFNEAIKSLNYQGKFIYLNANKANYGIKEIEASFSESDGLETSSYYDLLLTRELFIKHKDVKTKIILSNGYKEQNYLDGIIKLNKEGFNITDIIDSVNEYEYLKNKNVALNVGLRIHLSAKYIEDGEVVKNDRFGLTKAEFDYILNDIKNTKLTPTIVHFHQRGFDYEKAKFRENFEEAFKAYAEASKIYSSIVDFDMGGGTPLPSDSDFDYKTWTLNVIKFLKELSLKYDVKEPNLISENGKYAQKDATINIYKVIGKKDTDEKEWNIVDGSPLIAMPEMYALGEEIIVSCVNGLDQPTKKGYIAGLTCDCDDIYYDKSKGYFDIPDIKEDLYIALLGTGSYQNSMNGKGGVHHCLLPEEKDLLVYNEKGKIKEEVRHDLQSFDEIMKIAKP